MKVGRYAAKALDLAEMVIELSAQAGEPLVVVRLQLELEGRRKVLAR